MVALRAPGALVLLIGLTVVWGFMMLQFGSQEIYPLVGGYALFASVCALLAFGPKLRATLRLDLRSVLIGLGVGVLMTLATYPLYRLTVQLVPSLEPVVRGLYRTSHKEQLGTALFWVVVILTAEELLFRGAWLLALERRFGRRASLALSVGLYALAQACTGSLIVALLALTCGLVWTVERMMTGSVVAPWISHLIWTPTVILLRPVVA
ncbi:MAG TPA: type II CAAX endopeptidase family protein [Polyangiales bacterium]